MKKQVGFTLVELVVVIAVLGLLAAAALPRFINVQKDARISSVNGVAGGLRSAASLGRAQYVVNGDNGAVTILMDGSNINVQCEDTALPTCTNGGAGRGGRPDGSANGIRLAMPDPSGYTITGTGGANDTVTYQPTSGGNATCQVVYNPTVVGDPVTATVTGC